MILQNSCLERLNKGRPKIEQQNFSKRLPMYSVFSRKREWLPKTPSHQIFHIDLNQTESQDHFKAVKMKVAS